MNIAKEVLIVILLDFLILNGTESKPLYKREQNNTIKCQDPTNDQLEEMLSKEFKKILNKIEEGIDIYPPVQQKYNISKNSYNENTNRRHGNQNCNRNDQTIWHKNEISICPYHFIEIKRKNRFPFYLKQATCNCKECIGVKKSKCLPVNIAKPSLERDYCSLTDGMFKWNFVMEFVTVSCSCKQKLELD